MTDDPYIVLGVDKTATQDEIKKAYRKLAKALHPDLHPDDAGKKAQFQAVSAAYDLLGNAEKRRRFDAGEIDASGQERPEREYYHQYAGQQNGRRYDPGMGPEDYADASDFFADLFGGRQRNTGGARQEFHARGQDLRYHLDVDLIDAVRGAKHTVTMPDGKTIAISIPAGVKDGQTLRLRGKGAPGFGQGQPGDALVTIGIRPHPVFTRTGDDIEIEVPITLDEAVLGAKIDVPTISGTVSMSIPKGASSGRKLRLKGKGVSCKTGKAGDQIVHLKIVLPDVLDNNLEDLARKWRDHSDFDPRADLRRKS
ncbi:DnaJ C-terminal domain-containing protein [Lutimaribacter saemankumensis]|uniref:DnaJ-class molecular chaperone with C-terminal Zn finger domain n=1 Tax=Lutimaribacter saemankumensis TaxID=490829 RepID=A0A1G8SB12_9RHOB|nr:DnaJ C-terminal domain-containing protein [Lutimaribacter saemankumensis]SDJ26418.1 DnaJ-class molecular chaperone with C-terminal Zn finger domain [Lutimaribacter saemankumensis]